MALLTLQEFAEKAEIDTKNLSNYIRRGNVVKTGELIDLSFAKNKEWLRKRLEKRSRKGVVTTADDNEADEDNLPELPPARPKRAFVPPTTVSKEAKEAYDLEFREQQLDIEIKEQRARYERIKADKAEGLVIPTDAVKILFLQYSKAITSNFRDSLESMVELLSHKHGIPATDVAALRKEGIDVINKAVTDAIDEAKKGLKNIVEEFSDTKGKGEK